MAATQKTRLALEGGQPSLSSPLPPMYPGGLRIDEEEEQAVLEVLRSRRLFRYYGPSPGPSKVAALEKAYSEYAGVRHCVAVTSGTAALICALVGLGIGPGDEVIVPAYTWMATASAVVAVGAVPILAEVDASLTLDPGALRRKISPYTRAVIPVHMRGAPCRMREILAVAREHGLKVLEDAAQANGASFGQAKVGSMGDAGAFSLQFNKIITSGEGGLVTTNDDSVEERILMYKDVVGGQRNNLPPERILMGVNYRMPELLGAVALVQLRRLDRLLGDMRYRKQTLKSNIAPALDRRGGQFRTINDAEGDAAVALIFYLPEAASAQRVAAALEAEGVGAMVLYSPENVDYHVYAHWAPIMNRRTWSEAASPWKNHGRDITYSIDTCPRTLDLLSRAVHIDVSPDLTNTQVEEMTEAIHKVMRLAL